MNAVMKTVVVVLLVGMGLLVYLIVRQNQPRPDILPHEVSADSIAVYQLRADSLAVIADSLENRFEDADALRKPGLLRRLAALEGEIDALKIAIDKWRATRGKYGEGQAYRECVLLYGRASGVCADLSEEAAPPDTAGE